MRSRAEAERFVRSYCNLYEDEAIPAELEWAVCRLAGEDAEESEAPELGFEGDFSGIHSISEGDTQVQFFHQTASGAAMAVDDRLPGDVKAALQRCRRVRWKT